MAKKETPYEKLKAIDYVVMIGGPLTFMAIFYFGMLWILGPSPPPSAIDKLKHGEVRVGMTYEQTLAKIGIPKGEVPQPDGGKILKYVHDTDQPGLQDEGSVDVSPDGVVTEIRIEQVPVIRP